MDRDLLAVNTLRALSMDQIDEANSGHPGLPLGAAPMAWSLWADFLNFTKEDMDWINRDRFILSAGHGSALLYSLLYVFDLGLTADDLLNFRQVGSKTPGHPEYGHTKGVETTTGPLGSGIATAVGFAMAEKKLAATYNREDLPLIDHYTYALVGDGCLMEGISNEASSLAGDLGLGKLIVLYDSNNITIEGSTDLAFRENVRARYEALNWQTLYVEDGNDLTAIHAAIREAQDEQNRPTLIEIKTLIGFGSPLQGTADVHGSPLGREKTDLTLEALEFEHLDGFALADEVSGLIQEKVAEKNRNYEAWEALRATYEEKYPEDYASFESDIHPEKKDLSFLSSKEFWQPVEKDMATRESSHMILQRVAKEMGNLFGGSADLAPSTKSNIKEAEAFSSDHPQGANIHFGVREHAMGAIVNGIALHGGFRAYGSTFLIFSDYMKPQLRLASLMGLPIFNIFTHDSIGVGEDGPTHQPIEQLTMLRSIPNHIVYRPCDSTEVIAGWKVALDSTCTPVSLALTRQKLPELEGTSREAERGGYILAREEGSLDLILLASGSEVHLAFAVKKALEKEGIGIRVLSIPSQELFLAQDESYREEILPSSCGKRVSIEAGATLSWHRFVGLDGLTIGIDTFGASGKGEEVFQHFGLTEDQLIDQIRDYIKRK